MDTADLEQLVAVAELGSFSEAARASFVSVPTVARAMGRVEEGFGVTLFERGRNRVTLNETGRMAAREAERMLRACADAVARVQAFDRSLRTIDVVSCAPAPLWLLVPRISRLYPGVTLASRVATLEQAEGELARGSCDAAVLPYRPDGDGLCEHLLDEHLYLCVRPDHALAGRDSVTFDEMNGFNFLLGSDLGFWDQVCRRHLTASRFLVQDDEFALAELIRSSSLPCFTTDVALRQRYRGADEGRVCVPITDSDASVSFYLVAGEGREDKVARLFGIAGAGRAPWS